MTERYLILHLDSPLLSFGGVAVDAHGFTDPWPSASLLTGLLGNALGYHRTDVAELQRLQDRLIFACRLDRHGEELRDFQTAELQKDDVGWTTRGAPEGRAGGAGTYAGMHIRYRHFWADRIVTVALRLEPAAELPDLEALEAALDRPARPLFIGRKPCLPAGRLLGGSIEAESALAAVSLADPCPGTPVPQNPRVFWSASETGPMAMRARHVYGRRDWRSGVHGGEELWYEGVVPQAEASA